MIIMFIIMNMFVCGVVGLDTTMMTLIVVAYWNRQTSVKELTTYKYGLYNGSSLPSSSSSIVAWSLATASLRKGTEM